MFLDRLLTILLLLFPVSEIVLAILRRSRGADRTDDRGSMLLLWIVIILSMGLAMVSMQVRSARLPIPRVDRDIVSLVLVAGGLGLRWASILTLGKFFTVDVAAHGDHRVIESGPYRHVRHPSYSGLLLAFLGVAVYFGSWLSLVALMVPVSLAVAYRIRVEESLLRRELGAAYASYCERSWRLIPGLL